MKRNLSLYCACVIRLAFYGGKADVKSSFHIRNYSYQAAIIDCSFNFPPHFRKEQAFATNLMERTWYSNVWIGLNDIKTKGVYEWSDNSSVSWTNWYVGQPDERRTDKSCVYMSLKRGKQGWMYWSDQNCTNKYAFMCAYDMAGK